MLFDCLVIGICLCIPTSIPTTMYHMISLSHIIPVYCVSSTQSINRTNVQLWWATRTSPSQRTHLRACPSRLWCTGLAKACSQWQLCLHACMQPWCTSTWACKSDVSLPFLLSLRWTLDWWCQGQLWSIDLISESQIVGFLSHEITNRGSNVNDSKVQQQCDSILIIAHMSLCHYILCHIIVC